jgi:hypothetical protein
LINLLAVEPELARMVLRAHGAPFLVTSVVVQREIIRDPRSAGNPIRPRLLHLFSDLVVEVDLDCNAVGRFVGLAGKLGDGEAATLAHAEVIGAVAVLDDVSARVAAVARTIPVEWTTDLLLDVEVVRALGEVNLADALHDALRFGRMRVPDHHRDAVVELVGEDRCRACPSLSWRRPR